MARSWRLAGARTLGKSRECFESPILAHVAPSAKTEDIPDRVVVGVPINVVAVVRLGSAPFTIPEREIDGHARAPRVWTGRRPLPTRMPFTSEPIAMLDGDFFSVVACALPKCLTD